MVDILLNIAFQLFCKLVNAVHCDERGERKGKGKEA